MSLFDASTPLEDRTLSPVYASLIIIGVCALARLWQRALTGKFAAALFIVVLLVTAFQDSTLAWAELRQDGQDFTGEAWRISPTIRVVKGLPEGRLYTNEPTAIYLLTGRAATIMPSPIDPVTALPRPNYASDVAEMRRMVLEEGAKIVIFGIEPETGIPVDDPWFADQVSGLSLIERTSDGRVYSRPE